MISLTVAAWSHVSSRESLSLVLGVGVPCPGGSLHRDNRSESEKQVVRILLECFRHICFH